MPDIPTAQPGLTILVVDDSRLELALTTAMLTKMGHEVRQSNSGETALEMFKEHMPDMVLMDVIMPGIGGFEAVREMRRIAQDDWIPIVYITGLGHEEDIVCGIEAGGDDYLLKPINFKMLQAKINSLQQHLRLFRQIELQSSQLLEYRLRNEEERSAAQEFLGRLLALDKIKDPLVQFHLQAAEVFSGDLIAAARTPAGNLYAMLADSTGHGLTAALAVMPVLQTFHAMVAKGYSIGALAAEINRKIGEYLPANRFVAAVLVAMDAKNGRVSVWNGGCPPALLINPAGGVVCRFESKHLPLGILNPNHFDDEATHYYYGNNPCQILLCSDGAVDIADPDSMEIGLSRLLQAAQGGNLAERLPGMVRMLEQRLGGKQAHDDIALVLLDCPAEDTEDIPLPAQPEASDRGDNLIGANPQDQRKEQRRQEAKVEWKFVMTLTAPQLRQADIVPLLLQIVNQIELGDPGLSGKLFLILSELFNNALDHGLLKLNSSLKNDPQGLDRYFEERSERLKQMEQGEIKIKLLKTFNARGPCLMIVINDTGDGFDYSALQASALNPSLQRHGRGIALVESLCEQLNFTDHGRESQACISLSSAE